MFIFAAVCTQSDTLKHPEMTWNSKNKSVHKMKLHQSKDIHPYEYLNRGKSGTHLLN